MSITSGQGANTMRPVKGVITGQKGSTLSIKVESGITINAPKRPELNVGKSVLVYYDFTRAKVKEVLLEMPEAEVNIEEKKEEVIEKGEMCDLDILDCGALPLSIEGCLEFWDDDSGSRIVVLSVPSFEGCGGHDPHCS